MINDQQARLTCKHNKMLKLITYVIFIEIIGIFLWMFDLILMLTGCLCGFDAETVQNLK